MTTSLLRLGPRGSCICPQCGERVPHRIGVPCREVVCARCGARMLRKGSAHFKLWLNQARKERRRQTDGTSVGAQDSRVR